MTSVSEKSQLAPALPYIDEMCNRFTPTHGHHAVLVSSLSTLSDLKNKFSLHQLLIHKDSSGGLITAFGYNGAVT